MDIGWLLRPEQVEFTWPWVFLLLPLPWLLRILLPVADSARSAALRVPSLDDFSDSDAPARSRSRLLTWLYVLAWLCLLAATARPQHVGDAIELPVSGRDLMLALDLSASMEERDFTHNGRIISRLQASKIVAGEFVERRVGDRVGLVLYGERAYLQSPLTFDRVTVKTFLDEAVLGLAGRSTAIGDAIGLALKRLRESSTDEDDRVLILMTDGANTAGAIDPRKAAELAAREGMKIYTIGIGSRKNMRGMSFFSINRRFAELDETTLKYIANTTGGRYFRAHDTRELARIYTILDELEPVERDSRSYRPVRALFVWPLSMALALAAILVLAHRSRR